MPVFIHSFTLSCIHSHIHSHIHSFIDSSTHSFIHVFIHSFVYAFIHSRIYSFTHSFTHLLPSRKNARHLVSLATVRVSKQKTPAVTGNTAGENASCMTDNRRRFHRQGQPLMVWLGYLRNLPYFGPSHRRLLRLRYRFRRPTAAAVA